MGRARNIAGCPLCLKSAENIFLSNLPFGRPRTPRRVGLMRDVSVFCSIFSGIFFVQARVFTCAHLKQGHGKTPRRPDGEIVPARGSLVISQGRVLYWSLLELAGDEAFVYSVSGRRHSYVSRLVESDTSHIQPPRFAGLPRAQ